MFEIEKDNFIIIILIFVLFIGIFVTSNPESVDGIKGKSIAFTGKVTTDDCVAVSGYQLWELRNEIDQRLRYVGQSYGWSRLWNYVVQTPDLRTDDESMKTDIRYVLEIRDALIYTSKFYWSLDKTINLKDRGSNEPIRPYGWVDDRVNAGSWNELYREVVSNKEGDGPGINLFENVYNTNCIREVDLIEIKKMVEHLKWIYLPTCCGPSIYPYYTPPKESESYFKIGKSAQPEILGSFSDAWDGAMSRYNNPRLSTDPYDLNKGEHGWQFQTDNLAASCYVNNYGIGYYNYHICGPGSGIRCESLGDTWNAERAYQDCSLKNLNINLPFEVKQAKLYYALDDCEFPCQLEDTGTIQIGDLGTFIPSKKGDYLLEDFSIDGIKDYSSNLKFIPGFINDILKPIESISKDDPSSYWKGIKGFSFRGFVVSPYSGCNKGEIENECEYMNKNDEKQFVKIGDSVCSNNFKDSDNAGWKVCENNDNDPCGEWKNTGISCCAMEDFDKEINNPNQNDDKFSFKLTKCRDIDGLHEDCEACEDKDTHDLKIKNKEGNEITVELTESKCDEPKFKLIEPSFILDVEGGKDRFETWVRYNDIGTNQPPGGYGYKIKDAWFSILTNPSEGSSQGSSHDLCINYNPNIFKTYKSDFNIVLPGMQYCQWSIGNSYGFWKKFPEAKKIKSKDTIYDTFQIQAMSNVIRSRTLEDSGKTFFCKFWEKQENEQLNAEITKSGVVYTTN